MTKLLLATDVAELLQQDLTTIRRRTRRGEIPGATNIAPAGAQRPQWRYDAKALEAWLTSRRAS